MSNDYELNIDNEVKFEIDIQDVDYTIELNNTTDYVIELNQQGPQGATGPQGPKGETGLQGPKGDKGDIGDSCVRVQVDEPTDPYVNVWINPNGTDTPYLTDVKVDDVSVVTNRVANLGKLASKNVVNYVTEVTNKPVMPTVNNGTLTIQKNGTTVGTFSANQSTNSTINIEADIQVHSDWNATSGVAEILNKPSIPSKTSDLTNDSDFITTSYHDSTKYDANNPSGYQTSTQVNTAITSSIINDVAHTDVNKSLSANMGKELQDQITNLKQRGRYLSVWNCTTGLATTEPTVNPYIYKAGDYFIVGFVGTTNYRPNGLTYDKDVASTTVETGSVHVNDTYYFDGTVWSLLATEQATVAFSTLAGQPYDNSNLASALNSKANESALTSHTSNTSNPHSVTKSQVGLGNVDNTSDLNKPISTATQTALNGKQATLTAGNNISISNNTISATDTTYTAGVGININNNVISTNAVINQNDTTQGLKEWCGTDNEYANISTKDADTLYFTFKQIGQILAEFTGYPLEITYAIAVALVGYKIYGNSKQSILPSGYTQLDYIQSSGSQYIDTGINPSNKKIGAIIDFQFTGTSRTTGGVFGSNNIDNTDNCQFTVYDSKWRTKINNYATYGTTYNTSRHIARCNMPDGTSLDSTIYTTTQYTIASTNTNNVYVGACNYNDSSTSSYTLVGKLYSAKVYDDTTLVRDFIPAKNSSNVIGMYDLVTNQFFTNAGSGTFTAGSVAPTPTAPIEIKSVGDKTENLTNYILNVTATGNGTQSPLIQSPELNVNWKENTQYTFSLDCPASNVTYSSEGNLIFFSIKYTDNTYAYTGIQSSNYRQGRISFTTTANKTVESIMNIVKHARWTGGAITISNLQIEEGTTATSYKPYGYKVPMVVNGTTQQTIYLTNPLAKVGTYADYIDYENQQVVRNVGVYTCTGTESWNWNGVSTGWFYLLTTCDVGTPFDNELCTHLQYGESGSDKFSIKANKYIYIFDDNGARWGSDATTFKAWLATQYTNGTPVTIYYPLATPTTESITLPEITMSEGTNTITTGTSLVPSNAYAKAYVSQE